jgi:hypothetical protein
MKLKLRINFLALLALLECAAVNAQVTIGSGSEPANGALLQLKETDTQGTDPLKITNATKGLLYPRVALTSVYSLKPLIETPTSEEKTQATGMIVFNTSVLVGDGLDLGVYMWNGSQWVLVSDAIGQAAFSPAVTEADIAVHGAYYKQELLKGENFLNITLNVSAPGKYNISATTANGYSFRTSGMFYNRGKHLIRVPGDGIPLQSTAERGNVADSIIVRIGTLPPIIKKNEVLGVPSAYRINCATISVKGTYRPGEALTNDNYITLRIISDPKVQGAVYNITTDKINGYSFSGSGTLAGTSNQMVYLFPDMVANAPAKPLAGGNDYFSITSNSTKSSFGCYFSIPVANAKMTIATYGQNWSNFRNNINKTIAADNFSPAGVYSIESITCTHYDENATGTMGNGSFDATIAIYNTRSTADVPDYINKKKKVFVYAADEGAKADLINLIKAVFGVQTSDIKTSSLNSLSDAIFVNTGNPITKGPFGNIGGKPFIADAGGNFGVKMDHPDFVPLALTSDGYARMFYHRTKGFLAVCDGGAISPSGEDTVVMGIFRANLIAWMSDMLN